MKPVEEKEINEEDDEEEEEEAKTVSALDPLWQKKLSDEQILQCNTILKAFTLPDRVEKFQEILSQRTNRIRFVFENPSNPNNIWAALRTFDSFGLQFVDIILHEKNDWESARKGRMTAALGSQKWLTLQQYNNTADCFHHLKTQGYTIIASDLHSKSVSLPSLDQSWISQQQQQQREQREGQELQEIKIAIVMGNEVQGITEEVRQLADQLVYIPMKGFAESFNLSVAAAILCSHFQHQALLTTNFPEAIKQRILFTWYLKSVKGSMSILRRHQINVSGNQVYAKIGNISTKP